MTMLRKLWRLLISLFRREETRAVPYSGPAPVLFDWHRDYGPLWEPGSTAFWLEPEASDIKPGVWPMSFVKPDETLYADLAVTAGTSYAAFRERHAGLYELTGGLAARGLMGSAAQSQAMNAYMTAPNPYAQQNLSAYQNSPGNYYQQQALGMLGSLLGYGARRL